jgi:hypothetical protein
MVNGQHGDVSGGEERQYRVATGDPRRRRRALRAARTLPVRAGETSICVSKSCCLELARVTGVDGRPAGAASHQEQRPCRNESPDVRVQSSLLAVMN